MIRILVVDDSLFMRKMISDMLNPDPDIKVIDTARNGKDALEKMEKLKPDVITLDLVMRDLTGLDTLRIIMSEHPTPVIMVRAYTRKDATVTMDCLDAGAVGFITKPSGAVSMDIEKVKDRLIEEIKKASKVNVKKIKSILTRKKIKQFLAPHVVVKEKVVVIGASTGGPSALELVLSELPFNFPAGILVVQHMPEKFTRHFAERLDRESELSVKQAEDGDVIEPGKAYVAPGDFHMGVEKKEIKGKVRAVINLNKKPLVHGLRPSIDVTMKSVAEVYGENAIGVLLTGMGEDGVDGMDAIKAKGGRTIAQDEATSLIYGMPKKVVENGDADHVLPVFKISQEIIHLL